jgi:hypothetical protein
MALSTKAKKRFEASMARRAEAQEITTAIDALHAVAPAATIAALGALGAVAKVDVADAGPMDVATAAGVDTRLATLQAKIDAILVSLKAAGLMS